LVEINGKKLGQTVRAGTHSPASVRSSDETQESLQCVQSFVDLAARNLEEEPSSDHHCPWKKV
jgi:hypothetical protein